MIYVISTSPVKPKREEQLARDAGLLVEYGFRNRTLSSVSLNLKKIDRLRMRQLDGLKMLLLRNEYLVDRYPDKVREGIQRNNFRYFARALAILAPRFRDSMS